MRSSCFVAVRVGPVVVRVGPAVQWWLSRLLMSNVVAVDTLPGCMVLVAVTGWHRTKLADSSTAPS